MNLLDHKVMEVLGEPYKREHKGHTWWRLCVVSHCYGRDKETTLIFSTQEEALEIEVGYVYQA